MIGAKGRVMVIEKKAEKGKTGLKIKARIGAWWKSTVSTESETPAERKNEGSIASESETLTEEVVKKTPRKRAPRKKPAVKSPDLSISEEPQSGKITPAGTYPETETVESPPEEKTAAKKKTVAKKPRRRKQWTKNDKLDDKSSPDHIGQAEESGGEGGTAEAGDSSVAEPEIKSPKGKEPSRPTPVRKLLINAEEPEECRIALLEDGRLESIHVSSVTRTRTKNNIYKAKIVAIEPSLQAAFVDYGTDKNGFLPFSEIHP
jgi:ribonuclease E